jgi:acyl-CoA synthetase (AMP-forming)/AMP-acid ligase II
MTSMSVRPVTSSLRSLIAPTDAPIGRFIADPYACIRLRDLAAASILAAPSETLHGRSVLLLAGRQLATALALAELDGIAGRVVLCTQGLPPSHLQAIMEDAATDTIVTDNPALAQDIAGHRTIVPCHDRPIPRTASPDGAATTEWVLLTSGTTGRPKLAVHTLSTLVGPLNDNLALGPAPVWSTFYDISRYGGLQILLRAFAGGASMVLSDAAEPVADFLRRAGAHGVTHISGTPSHWRRALMAAAGGAMSPGYIRLSGEACDQAILDHLRQAWPHAAVAHAFASTEAGVAFDVRDGLAGFPAALLDHAPADVTIRIENGSLRVRSSRSALRLLGPGAPALRDAAGFVDTGDMIEVRGNRCYFAGRREGIINVGGLKVHPETIEAVINRHPAVHMSRVSGRPNPITGAIVVAEIVLTPSAAGSFAAIQAAILGHCRRLLAAHEVPVILREVPSLDVAASGKLLRRYG